MTPKNKIRKKNPIKSIVCEFKIKRHIYIEPRDLMDHKIIPRHNYEQHFVSKINNLKGIN